jgi:acyl carrier protein
LRQTILSIVADVAPDADTERLTDDDDLRDELDIDSMDMLGVLAGVEERLGVRVAEADYGSVATLGGLVAYVAARRDDAGHSSA